MADHNLERDPLEVLAAEYMDRLRRGEEPSLAEYASRHPELADEINNLFPTIAATERLKARQVRSSGGRVTLGPAKLERLGDFRLIREIGRGGMGVVFEAEQESLGRRVAVKVLPRQTLLDEKHLKRFEREARIAANLHHTNIVEVFGVGEQDGFHYYVMQYIRGVGLETVIPWVAGLASGQVGSPSVAAEAGLNTRAETNPAAAIARELLGGQVALRAGERLSLHHWQNVARVGLQAADALAYAHSQGTLHRDIKPANLLIDGRLNVWLADFGLAKAAQSDDVSLSSDLVGTLRYMAPEVFHGQADHRSDLYSLGLTLYELLVWRPAYEETDHSRLIQRIAEGPPPAPSSIAPGIPRDLETIILKAISHEVGQRYQSVTEMADDLRRFLDDQPIGARRAGPVERLGRWCRRNRSLAALAGASLFLLALVAVVATVGYVRTQAALQGELSQRGRAETNAALAIEALDRIFDRFSPDRIRVVPRLPLEEPRAGTLEVPSSPILSREAAAILEEMLPFYDRLAGQGGDDAKLRAETAQANWRLGAIRHRLGRLDEAVKAYERAVALYQEWASRAPSDPSPRLAVAQIDNELGRLYASRRQAAEARQAHLAALALLQAEAARPAAPAEWRFELARTSYFLGTRERPLPSMAQLPRTSPAQVPEGERESLNTAVTLLTALAAQPPANPEYQHLLALCYLEGATVGVGGRPASRKGDERAIEILKGLVRAFPGNPDYAYDLSEAYARIHLPQPPIAQAERRTIEERFNKALTLVERLSAAHPDVPDFLAAEARMRHRIGSFQRQMERWGDAVQSFRQAVALQAPLVERFPDAPFQSLWLATFRIALADALMRQEQVREARTELEETIAMLTRQAERHPSLNAIHGLLALTYSKLEIGWRQAGEPERAAEAARKAKQEGAASRLTP